MPVTIDNIEIAALIDSGSSINVISQQLFNSLPEHYRNSFKSANEKILFANNASINIVGTARIKIKVPTGKHWLHVYILSQTSNPLILGTNYLFTNKIVLDFGKLYINTKTVKVMSKTNFCPCKFRIFMWSKLGKNVLYGTQGICTSSDYMNKIGLLTAKAVVSVDQKNSVPVKLMNVTNEPITIQEGKF
ncbi:unnamed protein product [Mytilus coruscus]|uniref:Retropepsins domain-containing protein n=1 Tax=Mytilus coruscus TaxID=42192 RepID=A0A6J8BVN3_MYTCO|nr:unnamed protein product [Mytilus coruscus]